MNRNSMTRFGSNPVNLSMERSRIRIPHNRKLTFKNGDLIPIFHMHVLPGDTISMDMAELTRMQTPIFPVADNMFLDTYFFFVPYRLLWDHFEEFMGENKDGVWRQEVEYTIPQLSAPENGWTKGTIMDYFGIPTNVPNISVSSFMSKRYVKCWNDWFRDENRKEPGLITTTDENLTGQNGNEADYSYITGAELGGAPLKVARLHDYFTSTLPEPQKGPDVFIPLGGRSGMAPITTGDEHSYSALTPMKLKSEENAYPAAVRRWLATTNGDLETGATDASATGVGFHPTNLWADLATASGGTTTQSTINQLRTAFAIQRHYEKLARGGSRYIEMVAELFGRKSADARFQRSEYLGGTHTMINMEAVLQTSATSDTSPQGNVSGNSKTVFQAHPFTKSFTEHGIIIGVQATRVMHSYQQGINRLDKAKDLFDLYFPSLAHIGEQPVYNYEIYAQGTGITDDDGNIVDEQVFGYQEAWRSYRYMPNIIAGEMRSNYAQSLDAYHYADYYEELPIGTSSEWIDEPYENVDRTIAVTSEAADQFISDINYSIIATRPMPLYSVPGLIDHY